MLHVVCLLLQVFLVKLDVFPVMLQVFLVMLHVFPVTLQETRATLQETPATLEGTPATLHDSASASAEYTKPGNRSLAEYSVTRNTRDISATETAELIVNLLQNSILIRNVVMSMSPNNL